MQRKLEEEDIIGIISKVKQGQSQAFNILILTYEKEVFSLCLRILKHREEAEEAAQDCFIKAYKQIRSFKQEAKFSTWLYRIAYNNCLNKIKANKRRMLDTELEE